MCFETFQNGTFPVILRHFPQSQGEYLETVSFHSAPRSVHPFVLSYVFSYVGYSVLVANASAFLVYQACLILKFVLDISSVLLLIYLGIFYLKSKIQKSAVYGYEPRQSRGS
jgi:hypothetical protein